VTDAENLRRELARQNLDAGSREIIRRMEEFEKKQIFLNPLGLEKLEEDVLADLKQFEYWPGASSKDRRRAAVPRGLGPGSGGLPSAGRGVLPLAFAQQELSVSGCWQLADPVVVSKDKFFLYRGGCMRIFRTACLLLACLSLPLVSAGQSLGSAAKKERERRDKNKKEGVVAREFSEEEVFGEKEKESPEARKAKPARNPSERWTFQ
jgi:hypothetical protein